jgi:hypothetical protein
MKTLVLAIILALSAVACAADPGAPSPDAGSDPGSSTVMDSASRPEGWTTATHGKAGPADYDTVFGDDRVHRIDLAIPAATYNSMLAELEKNLGKPGSKKPSHGTASGAFQDGPPPTAFAACEGLEPGMACTFDDLGKTITGSCIAPPDVAGLVCAPAGTTPPGAGLGFEPMWAEIAVRQDGLEWPHVAMRFKGYSSLKDAWRADSRKLPFRLNFDKFEDAYPEIEDQRFFGFKKLVFNNAWRDASLIRDKLASDSMREAGIPVARCAFYEVWADIGDGPVYWGLYTAFEDPSDEMPDVQLGGDGGNLYEAENSRLAEYDPAAFTKQTNDDDPDTSDLSAFIEALHADRSDLAAWRGRLEARFDVAGFLRVLAANTVIANWDAYGIAPHNYLLYADPGLQGRFRWIPTDLNESFKTAGTPKAVPSLSLAETGKEWPLIRFLMDDPNYAAAYRTEVAAFAGGAFESARILARIDSLYARIEPSVQAETGKYTVLASPDAFRDSLDKGENALKPHVAQRLAAVAEFLK